MLKQEAIIKKIVVRKAIYAATVIKEVSSKSSFVIAVKWFIENAEYRKNFYICAAHKNIIICKRVFAVINILIFKFSLSSVMV